jgi:hypothetical protein
MTHNACYPWALSNKKSNKKYYYPTTCSTTTMSVRALLKGLTSVLLLHGQGHKLVFTMCKSALNTIPARAKRPRLAYLTLYIWLCPPTATATASSSTMTPRPQSPWPCSTCPCAHKCMLLHLRARRPACPPCRRSCWCVTPGNWNAVTCCCTKGTPVVVAQIPVCLQMYVVMCILLDVLFFSLFCTWLYVCLCVCVYMCVYIYICMHVYVHVYIYMYSMYIYRDDIPNIDRWLCNLYRQVYTCVQINTYIHTFIHGNTDTPAQWWHPQHWWV